MADVTLYKDPAVTVVVVDGDPPVDQTAEVAALTAQVDALTAEVATLNGKLSAGRVAAQATVDALA